MMTFGTANPGQLAVLAAALDDYCAEAGIAPRTEAREDAARLILDLFNRGVEAPDAFKAALRARSRQNCSHST